MFGTGRCVFVDPASDDAVEAVTALLQAPAAGNPVVLLSGALKATSKILKAALADTGAIVFASYQPDARDLDRLVADMARERGLSVRADVASRIGEAAGGNRAVIDQELDKFAAYLDAAPGRMMPLDHDVVEAVGASLEEGDTTALVNAVFDGNNRTVEAELARLRSEGSEGITLIRAALRRAVQLARMRARVEEGQSPASVMGAQGKSLFWKEKDAIGRQLEGWRADRLARCVARLSEAEREVKASGGLGSLAADVELLAIARQAQRRS
jgi:DNA polymerase-3 subunit delta